MDKQKALKFLGFDISNTMPIVAIIILAYTALWLFGKLKEANNTIDTQKDLIVNTYALIGERDSAIENIQKEIDNLKKKQLNRREHGKKIDIYLGTSN